MPANLQLQTIQLDNKRRRHLASSTGIVLMLIFMCLICCLIVASEASETDMRLFVVKQDSSLSNQAYDK